MAVEFIKIDDNDIDSIQQTVDENPDLFTEEKEALFAIIDSLDEADNFNFDVFNIEVSSGGPEQNTEQVSFTYNRINWTYSPMNEDDPSARELMDDLEVLFDQEGIDARLQVIGGEAEAGSGAGSGKVLPQDLNIIKRVYKASPADVDVENLDTIESLDVGDLLIF